MDERAFSSLKQQQVHCNNMYKRKANECIYVHLYSMSNSNAHVVLPNIRNYGSTLYTSDYTNSATKNISELQMYLGLWMSNIFFQLKSFSLPFHSKFPCGLRCKFAYFLNYNVFCCSLFVVSSLPSLERFFSRYFSTLLISQQFKNSKLNRHGRWRTTKWMSCL